MLVNQTCSNQWVYQLRDKLRNCDGSITQIEQLLADIRMELDKYSEEEITECLAQDQQVTMEVIAGYEKLIKQITHQKKDMLQGIQHMQKSTNIIHSYVQSGDSSSFVDIDL